MTEIIHTISGNANGDGFGHSVSLSSDGTIVAISAPYNEGDLTEFQSGVGVITNETPLYYQMTGNPDWDFRHLSRISNDSNVLHKILKFCNQCAQIRSIFSTVMCSRMH